MVKQPIWKLRKLREDLHPLGGSYFVPKGQWLLFRKLNGFYMPWRAYETFEGAVEDWKIRLEMMRIR